MAKVSGDLLRVGRTLLRTAADPVVWVFVLAATFEVLTGDPLLHALLLCAVAAVGRPPFLRPLSPAQAGPGLGRAVDGGYGPRLGCFPLK